MADSSAAGVQTAQMPALDEPAPGDADDTLVAGDLLVEEISIDGMCGVY